MAVSLNALDIHIRRPLGQFSIFFLKLHRTLAATILVLDLEEFILFLTDIRIILFFRIRIFVSDEYDCKFFV